jgi:phospholipid N-methyltransferase
MPSVKWLQKEFSYGYDSGDILSLFPDRRRKKEEKRCGCSYTQVFKKGILPYMTRKATVLELGPGAGSWSRALLKHIPKGRLLTVDFQDTTRWLNPADYRGRLTCFRVSDNSFDCIDDGIVDLFFSFGVLCHNNITHITEILRNALPKMKSGGYAAHQYGDWDKLEAFGWEKGGVPLEFKNKPDDEIWWPRNNRATMTRAALDAGWEVVNPDLDLLRRDGFILLRRPH